MRRAAILALLLLAGYYHPPTRPKTIKLASLACGPCVVTTPNGAVLVGTCEEGWCDELV